MKKLIAFSILILAFIMASGQKVSNTYQYATYHYGGIKVGKSKRTVQIDSIVNQSGMLKFYSGGASVPVTVDTGDVATRDWVTSTIEDGPEISTLTPMLIDSTESYVTPTQMKAHSISRDSLYVQSGKLYAIIGYKKYELAFADSVSSGALGPELITNGTFDSETGWYLGDNANQSITGGKLVLNDPSGWCSLYARGDCSIVTGHTYRISVTVSGYSTGTLVLRFGSSSGVNGQTIADNITANGTYTYDVPITYTVTPDYDFLRFMEPCGGQCVLSIDDVSIKEVY